MCNLLYKIAKKGQFDMNTYDRKDMGPAHSQRVGILYNPLSSKTPELKSTPAVAPEKKGGLFKWLLGGEGKSIEGAAIDVLGGFAKSAAALQGTKDETRSLLRATKRMQRGY